MIYYLIFIGIVAALSLAILCRYSFVWLSVWTVRMVHMYDGQDTYTIKVKVPAGWDESQVVDYADEYNNEPCYFAGYAYKD